MTPVHITRSVRRTYDLVYQATEGGTKVFEGRLERDGRDHSQVSRELTLLAGLGVITCERAGWHRRVQVLLQPDWIVSPEPRRTEPPPKPRLEREPSPRVRRYERENRLFAEVLARAFPDGVGDQDAHVISRGGRYLPHRPDARAL